MLSGVAPPLLLLSVHLQAKATIAVADADLYTQEQQVCLHINIHVLQTRRDNVPKWLPGVCCLVSLCPNAGQSCMRMQAIP